MAKSVLFVYVCFRQMYTHQIYDFIVVVLAGIRKLIHVKKGNQQNSILLPVTFKNGSDIRSIKIIKPSIVNKSPKILMAASNLLQEYKMKDKTSCVTTIPEQHYGK